MFDSIRSLFNTYLDAAHDADGSRAADREHGYQLATAALLLEMTRADHAVDAAELDAVTAALRAAFELDDAALEELVRLADGERDAAACLYGFTRTINEHLAPEEKVHIVELLWRVAYADGNLDRYEEHLVRKVADLLYVPHGTFINAKLRVAAEGS